MSWGEAYRLTLDLLTDPSSRICAAVRGWTHPIDRPDMVLRDLFDLQHRSLAKRRPDPYPRPWDPRPRRIGRGTSLSAEDFAAIKKSIAEQN